MGTTRVILEKELIGGSTIEHVYPVTSDYAVYNINNVNIPKYTAIVNVNAFVKQDTSFLSKTTARTAVNEEYRHTGVILTYNYNGTWISEQFITEYEDSAIWLDDNYWIPFGSGGGSSEIGTLNVYYESQSIPSEPESFSNVINLHAVSKTGFNSDLIDFVGKVVYNNNVRELGIIFNDYENNHAPGANSSAFGYSSIASGRNQMVIGRYNVKDDSDKYAFIIGNGNSNNRLNIFNIQWNGTSWISSDVCCGGTVDNPTYRLSDLQTKFDSSDLIDDFTENISKPASSKAVYSLYNLINGSKYAYSFQTLEEMVTDQNKGLLHVSADEYKQGGQLLMQQTGVSDYWITMIKDTQASYTWIDDETFESDVESAKMLQIGYYVITKLETGSIDLTQYVKKTKLKTVNNILLFDDSAPDGEAGNIPFPTTTSEVEQDNDNAVTSSGVYDYIIQNTISTSALKTLNTSNTTSQQINSSELLYGSTVLNLHKISKTGENTDLINYVGKRVSNITGAEIFNDYVGNTCTGTYSHVEGANNTCSGSHCHISGASNTATNNYCNVFGLKNNASKQCQTVFGKYNENKANSIFEIGWGESASVRGNLFDIDNTGKVWSKNTISIGTVDTETEIPDINTFNNNDLVTKYYVDTHSNSLFKGIVNTNSDLESGVPDGSTYIVKLNTCSWIDENYNTHYINSTNITNTKIGSKWYGQYDIITFTDDTDLIQDANVVGGTKIIHDISSYNLPVYLHTIAKTGSYNDLTDTPDIPTVPTNISSFVNDSGYITSSDIPTQVNADWNAVDGPGEILNKPTLFSGDYNDLANKPTIPVVNDGTLVIMRNDDVKGIFTANTEDTVLVKINVPVKTSDLTNDSDYQTYTQVQQTVENYHDDTKVDKVIGKQLSTEDYTTVEKSKLAGIEAGAEVNVQSDWSQDDTTADDYIKNKPVLSTVATTGNYNDLSNTPTIPSIQMEIQNIANNTWNINGDSQTFACMEITSNTTLTLNGTTNTNELRIPHIIKIRNNGTSECKVTLSTNFQSFNIECLQKEIHIQPQKLLELSAYVYSLPNSSGNSYIISVTEYNFLSVFNS